jgi:hypothetical protein
MPEHPDITDLLQGSSKVAQNLAFICFLALSSLLSLSDSLFQLPKNRRDPQRNGKAKQKHIRHVFVAENEGTQAALHNFSTNKFFFTLHYQDWNNIISLYQKNSIFLVEAASFLQRNATYELPSVKKQMARNQQLQQVRNHRPSLLEIVIKHFFEQ